MPVLTDHQWQLKYTPDDGNLVKLLYVPALQCAERYDRLTGYFNASALSLASRGVEGLVLNQGRMRLVVGCTLDQPEINAIEQGENLKAAIENRFRAMPLDANGTTADALELLAWMIAQGHLEVRVAVPCDKNRKPIPAEGIFHEKCGIIEDRSGNKIAFCGSLNETAAGWLRNWESLNVFTSWDDCKRVEHEEANFARIWSNQANHVVTLDIPTAVRDDLLQFLPPDDTLPKRLKVKEPEPVQEPEPEPSPEPPPFFDMRKLIWGAIRTAPMLPLGGERVGEATCAVTPWPHQVKAFSRMTGGWPTKLLIADEVGLGKTVQAGLLIRQTWLSGKSKRILLLIPKNVRNQWQIEMREKFNLNIPIYDGQRLCWYPSPGMRGHTEKPVDRSTWHKEPIVIVSSHLMRRKDRQAEILEQAEPWDLVVLDEAHHARRKGAGSASEGGANTLLRLMRGLRTRTQALLLLTATPMQVAPVEVWDLLDLLGLPPAWSPDSFVRFFDDIAEPNPSPDTLRRLSHLFRACEATYGPVSVESIMRFDPNPSKLRAKKVLDALRNAATDIPIRKLETNERKLAVKAMKANTPVSRLISRHTRELLRKYHAKGMISSKIATRHVEDRFVKLTLQERTLYNDVQDYISSTYAQATVREKNAVGFVLTIYRKRLASSFFALRRTLENHLTAVDKAGKASLFISDDDIPDDDLLETTQEITEADDLETIALAAEEKNDINKLLDDIRYLPPDSKLTTLRETLVDLRKQGYRQAMVFTQFTDTMDFLRRELAKDSADIKLMCFSGRGGEVMDTDGSWRVVSRDDVKRNFREGKADVLLCTDAASEGLNFQFCGSLINYDVPWNPMRVEQRIGRIDRLGQKFDIIQIVNLHYEDTVETDVYMSLRERIGLFESVVGRLQPILSKLPSLISESILKRRNERETGRLKLTEQISSEAERMKSGGGFDLDEITEADLAEPFRPASPLSMDDLDRVLGKPDLLPPGFVVKPLGKRQYALSAPGLLAEIRVSTDPGFVEEHPDDVELWSPGNPIFQFPEDVAHDDELPKGATVKSVLATH